MKDRLKKILKQNHGVALLLVLCLFALLIGLGASIFYASVTSVRSMNRETAARQAYLSAYSVCEVLADQIITKDGREDTELMKIVSNLNTGDSVLIDSDLLGNMGSIQKGEGEFSREGELYGILNVTVTVRKEKYTLQGVFSREEWPLVSDEDQEIPDADAGGGKAEPDTEVLKTEWIFEGYRPVVAESEGTEP